MTDTAEKTQEPSLDDLATMIRSAQAENLEVPAASPEPEPEITEPDKPEAPASSEVELEAEVPAVAEPTGDPEAVARALRDDRVDLLARQHEDLRKKYADLQKHSSRLASQLGRSRQDQAMDEPDGTVPEVFEERFSRLEERLNRDASRQAVAEELGRYDRPEIQALKLEPEIKMVAERHRDRIRALQDVSDPDEARLAAREIAVTVLSDAIAERMRSSAARSAEAASTATARVAAKKAGAALSNSGGTRATARKPAVNPMTMPLDDLKAMIEATRPE